MHHAVAISEFKLKLQSVNAQIEIKFVSTPVTLTFDFSDVDMEITSCQ